MTARKTKARKLKHHELKRECLSRGLDLKDYAMMTDIELVNWLESHGDDERNSENLKKYDEQLENELIDNGFSPEKDPELFDESHKLFKDESSKPKSKPKPKSQTKPKPKTTKEIGSGGVKKGTKKELTFRSFDEGLSPEETIARVLEEYPDAKEKSIKIWYKKYEKSKQ